MPETISVTINGKRVDVTFGTSVLAAILSTGNSKIRRSVTGEARGPVCGMGICFECRATVNQQPQMRTCQLLCAPGMDIRTDD